MATSATTLSANEINIALNSLKDTKNVLFDINELMEKYVNSESSLKTAVRDRLEIEKKYQAIIREINKKKIPEEEKYEQKLQAQNAYAKQLNEHQKKYSEELKKILDYQKAVTKEVEYQNKKHEEGVTLNERIGHQLEGHLTGYKQISKGLSETKKGFVGIFNVAKDIISTWGKVNQTAADYTKSIGGSAESMRKLTTETIRFVKEQSIGMKYNTSMEELIKLQESYNKSIGRSVALTNSQKETMAAMRKVAGDETTVKFAASLENFGLNPDEVGGVVGRMFETASRSGVVWSKYSDNFLNNIKTAQNYTFRNGLEGLQSMAKKAAEIKLDMKQAEAFANKVSTLEGAVKAGANLSVLGGSFAQFGNPLSMMYEGLNDMEGLQDRLINMFGNLGKWNSKTNMIDVSVFDKQRIRAAAEATGMDYSSIMDMIQAKGRSNQVQRQLQRFNFSGEEADFIKNQAQLDKNGNAFMTVQGKRKYLSDISSSDIQLLMDTAGNDTDNIRTIAQTLTGWNDAIEGLKKQKDAIKAGMGDYFGNWLKGTIFSIGTNVNLMALAVISSSVATLLNGGAQLMNGMWNVGVGLGRGFQEIPNVTTNSNASVAYNSLSSFKNSPAGAKDSFSILGRKYKITNNRGVHAVRQNIRGGYTSIGAEKYFQAKEWAKNSKGMGVAAGVVSAINTGISEFGMNNNHSLGRKIGATAMNSLSTGLGTWLGGALGTIILPGIGSTIGAALGGWLSSNATGLLWNDARRNRFKGGFELDSLTGDYSVRQLKRFNEFKKGDINALTDRDIRMLKRNGDYEKLKAIRIQNANLNANNVNLNANGKVVGLANGGWVSGPGGPKDDSVLVPTSNGEFIVNAQSAAANAELLKTINSSKTTITPRGNIMNPVKVNGGSTSSSSQNRSIDFGNGLNINLGGTIKLDLGNRTIGNIRPEDILSQNMINQIIKEIQKQINRGFNGEKQGIFKFA
nr:MAG TPA: hypothetical protein [Herelleviridae sp.]